MHKLDCEFMIAKNQKMGKRNNTGGLLTQMNFWIKRKVVEKAAKSMPTFLVDLRLREVGKILSHAAQRTRYWREAVQSLKLNPKDLTDLKLFEKLPLTTRAYIKEKGSDIFLAEGVPKNRRLQASTSGSTGEPFTFYQDTEELIKRRLDILYGLSLHGVRPKKPAIISGLDTHTYLHPLGHKFSNLRDKESRNSILYPLIERTKPEILFCTPSYLKFFYECLKQDSRRFFFKMIYCAGEAISEKDRKTLSSVFRSKVSMWYGTRETGPIAVECVKEKYHLLPRSNYVEIVNSSCESPDPGEEGDVVVTSFSNYVMPFIRYKTGDRGILLPSACDCGSSIPILRLTGRVPTIIEVPQGNSFTISEISTAIAVQFSEAILKFQFVEVSGGKYIFRFIPSNLYIPEFDKSLLKMFYKITGTQSEVRLEKVQTILPNELGKTPIFLKLVK